MVLCGRCYGATSPTAIEGAVRHGEEANRSHHYISSEEEELDFLTTVEVSSALEAAALKEGKVLSSALTMGAARLARNDVEAGKRVLGLNVAKPVTATAVRVARNKPLTPGWTVVDAKSARIEAAAEKASGSSSSTAAAETATTEAATEDAVAAKHTFSPGRKEWAGWAKPKKRWEQALDTFNVVFASFLKKQQVDSVVPQPFVSGLAERLKEKSPPKKKRIVTEWGLIIEVGEPASKGLNYTSGYSTTTGLRGRGACF